MNDRSSSTMLPPVRRRRRRDWVRLIARVLCVVFAAIGLLPVGLGLLVRTSWARKIATDESRTVLAKLGIEARYDLELKLWPLGLSLRDVRVESSDGAGPFLTAKRVGARPKIFGLLAGKLVIDQIEVEQPVARIVLRNGELQNLKLDLPKDNEPSKPLTRPPFSVVSVTEADVDVDVDGNRFRVVELDADVTTDVDDHGKPAFELALRVGEARAKIIDRSASAPDIVAYEDTLCQVDARARLESGRFVVRRFSTHGVADLEKAPGSSLGCELSREDKRTVEVELGHVAVVPPVAPGLPKLSLFGLEFPLGVPKRIDGRVRVRAPLALLNRLPDTPEVDGWVSVDVEARYSAESPIPDATGKLEARGIRVDHYSFARSIKSEFAVRRGIVTAPVVTIEIADGVAELKDIEALPLGNGIPLKVGKLDARDVNFTSLMHDLGVARRPHVAWDLKEVHASAIHGTLDPLHLDGDLVALTRNFAVYDDAVDSPTKTRAVGVAVGDIRGKLAVRPVGIEFQNTTVTTSHSTIRNVLVSLGFHEVLRVEIPSGTIDLADVSPIGSVAMGGVAEIKATVAGPFGDPHVDGDLSITNYTLGDKPNEISFGNVTQGHVAVEHIVDKVVKLTDIRAQRGKSDYEVSTGRLEFGGQASLSMEAQAASKNLDLRDFFSMFKLDEDPRFEDLGATIETNARVHLALGGPEDKCGGGYIEVVASTAARDLNVFKEKFDEGHADFEYRWHDRQAGIEGAEIEVRSLSLSKVKREGRAAIGSVLGALSIHRGGDLRGNLVVQGFPLGRASLLGTFAPNVEGSASGIAQIGGTISAFDIQADVDVTPIRVMAAPFGSSDLHFQMTQNPSKEKVIGKTACGAPIRAPFDKDAYAKDTSVQGEYRIDGSLFAGQVKLDKVVVTRQKSPVVTGRVGVSRLDLAPVLRIASPPKDTDIEDAPLGGEVSGDLVVERIAFDDLAHAKAEFVPRTLRVSRGPQRIDLRTAPAATTDGSIHPAAALMPPIRIVLADDVISFPPMTFDLAAPNGLRGALATKGSIKQLTRGGDLAIEAQLLPIDLGILVGAVPKMNRALGKLSGSVRIGGKFAEPDFDGQFNVRGGEFGIAGAPGALTDVEVDIIVDENEARVTRATGHFLGGDVGMTARMPLKNGQIGVAEATLTGRQMFLAPIEGVKATFDADLVVTVNPYAATTGGRLPLIGGAITITSFEYTAPFTLNLSGLRGGAKRTIVEAYDPTLDVVNLGFDVRSRVPLRIHNNLFDAQLAMDQGLRVTGTNQRIGLRGELAALPGGRFRVFANDFEVRKASIRFDDPTRIAPILDLVAVTEYRRYNNTASAPATAGVGSTGGAAVTTGGRGTNLWRITLHAYGERDELKVDMTSDPALSNEDILLLLTIGMTRAEVDQVKGSSAYAGAAFEALGTLSGVDRAVKQVLPVIDDLRPGSGYSSRTGRVEPNITAGGRIVGNTLRYRVTTGLAEDPQLRSVIEWRLNQSMTVEPSYDRINTATTNNVGNIGLDLRWRLEFE